MKRSRLVCIFLLVATATLLAQSNPVALIYQPLTPSVVEPGHATFTLTVRGTTFVQGASVQWNGISLKTRFVSAQILKAQVPAKLVTAASTASITVKNPGSIASNVIYFSARMPSSTITVKANTEVVEAGQIAIGDFNNDSKPDVSVQAVDAFLDVYLNNGHGLAKVSGPEWGGSGVQPAPIDVIADFNGDGNLDLSMCFSSGGPSTGCVIYLGDGLGNLTQVSGFNVVQGSGTAADMNRDGILDYVTVVKSSDGIGSSLLVNIGNGDGTFQSAPGIPLSGNKIGGTPVVGDFNHDGRLDVAVPVGSSVAVFLQKTDGTFRKEVDYTVANPGSSLAVADVNGDGILDIVTSGVSVLLGKGDGTFTTGSSILLPVVSGNLEIADINGDGALDLVTATMDSDFNQTVNILLGEGNGSFQNPIAFSEGEAYFFPTVGVADLNDDGKLDIIVSGQSATTVLIQNSPTK